MTPPDLEFARTIRAFWDQHPHDYHARRECPPWFVLREIDRKVFKHHAPWAHERFPLLSALIPYAQHRTNRVLDLGCGTGWGLEQFVRQGARGMGLDPARSHLGWTEERLRGVAGFEGVIEGDGTRLPFADGAFDVVLCWGVVMHTRDPAAIAREIHRVLRPGGTAYVMLYHANSLHWRWTLGFLHGVLALGFLRHGRRELFRRLTNNPELGGSPVARAYTRRQARDLFAGFASCRIEVNDQAHALAFFPSKRLPLAYLLPAAMRRWLARRIGFHLWLRCTR
ncbi:MAG: class I SAM-dependent methyltransferase [Planctomycetes bacterium]|nr:class I SAM-dependent methyltransferase [Planctomycetota bacterium]